jgi:tRNA nucleotidyltransferase/poly(A) polymerase
MLRDALLARFPALNRLPDDAFVVGGAIRDLLSEREPADVDVVCRDAASAARALPGRVVQLGRADLVAYRVIVDGTIYDLANRTGDTVRDDLSRRDFTIDAMAVELSTGEQHDPFGGAHDLEEQLVRMVAATNFDDDPLRMLKGVRLAVTFGFSLEAATVAAIRERVDTIENVAPERVTYELALAFGCRRFRRAVELLRETQLDVPLFGRALNATQYSHDDVSLAAAMAILVDNPRVHAARHRWSDSLLRQVTTLRDLLDTPADSLRSAIYDAGQEVARQLPGLLRARGQAVPAIPLDDAFFAIRPLLSGDEITAITSVVPGRELGRIKRELLEAQIEGRVATRDEAVRLVLELAG